MAIRKRGAVIRGVLKGTSEGGCQVLFEDLVPGGQTGAGCNLMLWEAEESGIQGYPWLHSEFKAVRAVSTPPSDPPRSLWVLDCECPDTC